MKNEEEEEVRRAKKKSARNILMLIVDTKRCLLHCSDVCPFVMFAFISGLLESKPQRGAQTNAASHLIAAAAALTLC